MKEAILTYVRQEEVKQNFIAAVEASFEPDHACYAAVRSARTESISPFM